MSLGYDDRWSNDTVRVLPFFSFSQTYTIQGKMDVTKVSALELITHQNHQIGRTRFYVGDFFSDDERKDFLSKGEDKLPAPTPTKPAPTKAAPDRRKWLIDFLIDRSMNQLLVDWLIDAWN